MTDPHSLDHLDHWRNEFLQQVGGGLGGGGPVMVGLSESSAQFPFVVLGNKADKTNDHVVPVQRAEQWCADAANAQIMGSRPFSHYLTSAKINSNVEEAFHEVARLALQYEEYKKRMQPQLFTPPTGPQPIDLRHQASSGYQSERQQDQCC